MGNIKDMYKEYKRLRKITRNMEDIHKEDKGYVQVYEIHGGCT